MLRLYQRGIIATATRAGLAGAFLAFGVVVTVRNVREIVHNPTLGTDYVYYRRAELVREIEGVAKPTKREIMSLDQGDGMRFLAFARDHLPEDSTLIFPGGSNLKEALGPVVFGIFKVALHPRKLKTGSYDFRKLPYDPAQLAKASPPYRYTTRDYVHSSRHFVFQVFTSPDAKTHRFFRWDTPVSGTPAFHTVQTYVFYPEAQTK